MALLTLVCTQCNHKQEELIFNNAPLPVCEKCGGETVQCFSGKSYGHIGSGSSGDNCTHNCATCKGCGK